MNAARIVYSQSLGVSSDNRLDETAPQILPGRVIIRTDWFKDNLGRNGGLPVALGLHVIRLATPADHGRLHARVTDTGRLKHLTRFAGAERREGAP